MTLNELRERIPDFGRDIKLNLETLVGPEGCPGLTPEQTSAIALACAFAVKEPDLAQAIQADLSVTPEIENAAKGAATIMAMNNVYYRSMHLLEDEELSKLPAQLRMNIIGKSGAPKVDFELMSLAVSAISGCGMCLKAHVRELRRHGITHEGIQSTIRIAAVVNATKQALCLVA
jgi:alkyl hydroperoxide reductase subunit D